jgi:hypothetical protein
MEQITLGESHGMVIHVFAPEHTTSIEKRTKPGMVVHTCNPSNLGGRRRRIKSSRPVSAI